MTTGFTTTNFPNGVTNAPSGMSPLGSFVIPDETAVHQYVNDFDTYTAAQWTVTKTQSGATQAIVAGDGGILALGNTSANNDLDAIQLAVETFAFTSTKQAWMKCRFKLSSATNAAAVIGLQITDTTPLAVSDGVFFSKEAASTTLNLVVEKSSTATTTAVGTMADDTYVEVGCHYDGMGTISIYKDGNRVGSCASTNLPTHTLCVSMAVSNGTAAAQTMSIDYFLAATER